jgi:hypothetical protein
MLSLGVDTNVKWLSYGAATPTRALSPQAAAPDHGTSHGDFAVLEQPRRTADVGRFEHRVPVRDHSQHRGLLGLQLRHALVDLGDQGLCIVSDLTARGAARITDAQDFRNFLEWKTQLHRVPYDPKAAPGRVRVFPISIGHTPGRRHQAETLVVADCVCRYSRKLCQLSNAHWSLVLLDGSSFNQVDRNVGAG